MTTTLLVNIDVDDLPKATDFYCKAFGLTVGRRFGSDAVELLGATSPIYLLVKPNGTVASATSRHLRSYARHWTPVHLDFVVDEIEGAVDRARNAGARLEGPGQDEQLGQDRDARRSVRARHLPDRVRRPWLRRDRDRKPTRPVKTATTGRRN